MTAPLKLASGKVEQFQSGDTLTVTNGYFTGTLGVGTAPLVNVGLNVNQTLTKVPAIPVGYGIISEPTFDSTITTAGYCMYASPITAAASFTLTTLAGVLVDSGSKGSGSTITTYYSLYIANPTIGNTNYSIYSQGGNNYLGGNLEVGGNLTLDPMTAGSVLYAGASGVISQDNSNFFWDATHHRLGIANTAPSNTMCIGADLGVITGSSCLTIGDATQPTLVLGKDSNNYTYMLFGSNGLTINTDQSSTFYTNTIVVNQGLVGIGGISPSELLTVNGNASVTKLANGQKLVFDSLTELTTIAASATSDTTFNIPINAVVMGVSVRVTVVIPTATTFTVTGTTSGTTFNTAAVSTASGSTDPGTKAGAFFNSASQHVRITPNLTPGGATGRVRVTCHYYSVVAATS